MTAPEVPRTCSWSNRHQPEQLPLIVTYRPVTAYMGREIVPARSDGSEPATRCEVSVAWPEVPAGAQLCPGMPVFCGAQPAPAETLTSSGQSIPARWSEWVTRST